MCNNIMYLTALDPRVNNIYLHIYVCVCVYVYRVLLKLFWPLYINHVNGTPRGLAIRVENIYI